MVPTGGNFGILPRGKTPEANTRAAFLILAIGRQAAILRCANRNRARALAYSGRAPDATTALRIFSMWVMELGRKARIYRP